MNLFTCKRHTVSGGERRPLRLLVAFLLLELPELGLDGHSRLLGFGVLHVDVKVLGDVRLGGVCEDRKKRVLRELNRNLYCCLLPEGGGQEGNLFYNDVSLQVWTVSSLIDMKQLI